MRMRYHHFTQQYSERVQLKVAKVESTYVSDNEQRISLLHRLNGEDDSGPKYPTEGITRPNLLARANACQLNR